MEPKCSVLSHLTLAPQNITFLAISLTESEYVTIQMYCQLKIDKK